MIVVMTGPDGTYTANVLAGIYTVIPGKVEMTFEPASHQVNVTAGNATNEDFIGTVQTYSISGHVRDADGNGIAGVEVTTPGASATTPEDGSYTLSGLTAGSHTVTPSLGGGGLRPGEPCRHREPGHR
jgi:hypothetical protein